MAKTTTHTNSLSRTARPELSYAFSLWGEVGASKIGTTPAGTLIDVDYTDLQAETKPDTNAIVAIKGKVIAGSDWALVRTDGVVEFDGRFTLRVAANSGSRELSAGEGESEKKDQSDKEDKSELINVVLSGVVDLSRAYDNKSGDQLMAAWDKDQETARKLPLALTMRFELATASEPWAAKQFVKPEPGHLKLTRSAFIATGEATLDKGLLSYVSLDVLEIKP